MADLLEAEYKNLLAEIRRLQLRMPIRKRILILRKVKDLLIEAGAK